MSFLRPLMTAGLLLQKQPPRGVPRKRFSGNMQQLYRRTPCRIVISIKLRRKFIEITLLHGCSPVNLLHIFRNPFTRNTSERLLLPLVGSVLTPSAKSDSIRNISRNVSSGCSYSKENLWISNNSIYKFK